jgi:hypothetical protein
MRVVQLRRGKLRKEQDGCMDERKRCTGEENVSRCEDLFS